MPLWLCLECGEDAEDVFKEMRNVQWKVSRRSGGSHLRKNTQGQNEKKDSVIC